MDLADRQNLERGHTIKLVELDREIRRFNSMAKWELVDDVIPMKWKMLVHPINEKRAKALWRKIEKIRKCANEIYSELQGSLK